MRPLSNHHIVAKAARAVLQRCPEAYFVFGYPSTAKDADYEALVRRAAQGSGTPDRFRFVEQIRHDAMPDYFRLADVTVSIPDYDGTPMSVLESMACGIPVVVGAIPDYDPVYIEPGATVATARVDDPDSIAEAIAEILQGSEAVTRRADEARRRVERDGSFDAQMNRMDQLYKSLVGSKTGNTQ